MPICGLLTQPESSRAANSASVIPNALPKTMSFLRRRPPSAPAQNNPDTTEAMITAGQLMVGAAM